jgi:outer membrane lipoprotein-sorting protein
MHRLLLFVILLISFGGNAQSYTKVKNSAAVKDKINKQAKTTSAIAADFKEVIYSSMYNNPKTGNGKLMYKEANKIRWEHILPKKQIVLINGSKVRLFEDGKEVKNVTSNQIIKKVQSLMMQLFSGDFLNEKEFNVYYYENESTYRLVLKPKNSRMSKYISKIKMDFDKKSLELKKMIFIETEADKIVYTFSSVTLNGQISDSNFTQF